MSTRSGAGFRRPGSDGTPQRDDKRRRRSPSPTSPTQPIQCASCQIQLGERGEHFVVKPCDHTLCSLCAYKSQTVRGAYAQRCPASACKAYPESCVYVGRDTRREDITIRNVVSSAADEYSRLHLPQLYLSKEYEQVLKTKKVQKAVSLTINTLQVQWDDKDPKRGQYVKETVTGTFALVKDEARSDKKETRYRLHNHAQAVVELRKLGAMLHTTVVKPSSDPDTDLPVMSPREYIEHRSTIGGTRALDALLYSMATGLVEFDADKCLSPDHQDYQRQICATVAASDVLLQISRDKPGYFQLIMHELMGKQKLTRNFQDFLPAFGLGPSRSYVHGARIQQVLDSRRQGLKVKPRDLVIILFDNVGFKVLGRQASYDQWVIVNIIVITEAQLKAVGFYKDDKPPSERISRAKSHVWEDEIKNLTTDEEKEKLAKEIVGINEEDRDRLSRCVLESIQFAIDNRDALTSGNKEAVTHLSRFDRIVHEQSREDMDNLRRFGEAPISSTSTPESQPTSAVCHIPRNYMPTNQENEIGGAGLHSRVQGSGIEDGECNVSQNSKMNRYAMNNCRLEVQHVDLSKRATVDSLMDYGVQSAKNQCEAYENSRDDHPENAEEPLAGLLVPLGCDGQPAAQAKRIQFEEADLFGRESALHPDHLLVSAGGFHHVLKTLNVGGELFEDILREVIKVYRDSKDKVNYYLFPNDPNQRKQEEKWYQLCHYHEAEQFLSKERKRKVTAVEVNDFMLERAEKYPPCALFLFELRVGSIIRLMINSERMGDQAGCVKYFFTAIKLAMPLFAITHKTDYMLLCTELLIWYHCASPAERIIYEKFIFTRLTSNGKSCFHDLFVELSVKDLRRDCGRVHTKGMDTKVEVAAAMIPSTAGNDDSMQTLRGTGQTDGPSRHRTRVYLSNDPMYCPFYPLKSRIADMMLWSNEPPRFLQGGRKKNYKVCDDAVLDVPGGTLDASILSSFDMGILRTLKYFRFYCIEHYGATSRTKGEVDLGKIDATVDSIKEAKSRELVLKTATAADKFQPSWCTIELMTKELEAHRMAEEAKENGIPVPKLPATTKRPEVISTLVKCRKKIFKNDPAQKASVGAE